MQGFPKGKLWGNVYQEPLLEKSKRSPSVFNKEFVMLVYLTIEQNANISASDESNPFENEMVEIDSFCYGVMHGQASAY